MSRMDASKSILKVQGVEANYLAKYAEADTSLDMLSKYVVVPRIKLIQGMTAENLKTAFGEGSAIVRPGDAMVVARDQPFQFVPLSFHSEACKWADRKDKEQSAILERTTDQSSPLFAKASNPATRFEPYEEDAKKPADKQRKYRYVEHLCFTGIIYGDNPLTGQQVALTFARGEYGQGRNWITAMKLRKLVVDGERRPMPLWSQVWTLVPKLREKGDKKWWGFDFSPSEPGAILEEEVPNFFEQHKDVLKNLAANRILVAHEDEDDPAPGDDGKAEM